METEKKLGTPMQLRGKILLQLNFFVIRPWDTDLDSGSEDQYGNTAEEMSSHAWMKICKAFTALQLGLAGAEKSVTRLLHLLLDILS